jgi:rhomboid family GlyGly-CTERM serine protease
MALARKADERHHVRQREPHLDTKKDRVGVATVSKWLIVGGTTAALVLGLLCGPETCRDLLSLRGDAWTTQPWRIVTFQLVHASPTHLAINSLGSAFLYLVWRELPPPSAQEFAAMVLGCGIGTLVLLEHRFVVGSSGLLHGLFAYYCVRRLLSGQAKWEDFALSALGATKILCEQFFDTLSRNEPLIGMSIATENHLAGALSGCAVALFALYREARSIASSSGNGGYEHT